jgi:hypothetical protein
MADIAREVGIMSGENRWRLLDGGTLDAEYKVFRAGDIVYGVCGNYRKFHEIRAAVQTLCPGTLEAAMSIAREVLAGFTADKWVSVSAMRFEDGRVRVVSYSHGTDYIGEGETPDRNIAIAGSGETEAVPLIREFYGARPDAILSERIAAHKYIYACAARKNSQVSALPLLFTVAADGIGEHGDILDSGTTFRRVLNVASDNTFHASTALNNQGSLVGFSKNTFSYSATATSITWSWGAFSIYLPDGTAISVSAGSAAAFTGLSASHSYHFGLYVTLSGPTVHVALSTQTSGTAKETVQNITQIFQADGNVAVSVDAIANTPASGTGGGSGGSDSCFSPNTKVKTKRGDVPIVDVVPGDLVLTARGTWCPVERVTTKTYSGPALDMGGGEIVTPRHEFLVSGKWQHAGELGRYTEVEYAGTIHNIHVLTAPEDDPAAADTEHSYTLANGVKAHNFNPT